MMNDQFLLETLTAAGQTGLVEQLKSLSGAARERLADQCRTIDWQLLRRTWSERGHASNHAAAAAVAQPPRAFRLPPAKNPWNASQALAAGCAALDAGQVGVILVAGGQGTRLGFDQPKGMFPIGPLSGATLYQILAEGVLAAGRRHQCDVPLYVMTSPATHAATEAYFAKHHRFGLPAHAVRFFRQGVLPAVDEATGSALLAEPDSLALSPDGHGGVVQAFAQSGCLADAERRGVKYLCYIQVDNPLVRVADAEFLGYHILSGSEMSTQVIAKRSPLEKVGNVVQLNDRHEIIEYSDLPAEFADRCDAEGNPIFWAGSIAVHVIETAFLRTVSESLTALPFHLAHKKVPYYTSAGPVTPSTPNAIKFERFVFDLLPLAREAIVMEVDRATTFGPVKNSTAEPLDNPLTVQAQMSALYRSWLETCGVRVPADVPLEISPLVARNALELQAAVQSGAITLPAEIKTPQQFR